MIETTDTYTSLRIQVANNYDFQQSGDHNKYRSNNIIPTNRTETYTLPAFQGAKRWHCGEFRVYAENENGEDAASILVTVTCT